MHFSWNCLKKDLEKRLILENVLPENYSYRISSFNLIRESEIPNESKFKASFQVNICSKPVLVDFLRDFEKSSSTVYNIKHADRKKNKKCSHIWFPKMSS